MQTDNKTEMRPKKTSIALMLTAVALTVACGYGRPHVPIAAADTTDGPEMPAYGAAEDIVRHLGYTASYNHTTLCPDWVAWELTADEADGQLGGQYSFSRDPMVSGPKASREDYSRSGWDKGHMAPRADMRWSAQALEESYFFTNICPQDHTMNSGAWRKIEELTRRMARRHGSVLAVCGPLYTSHAHGSIGSAAVQVPDAFYKALAVKTADGWQTVGYVVDNSPQDGAPKRYAVSVDSVETLVSLSRGTATDLFPTLPDEAEQTFNPGFWH